MDATKASRAEARRQLYEALASLFQYPAPGYAQRAADAASLDGMAPAAATKLAEFARQIAALPLEALEELYTQTFDLNPVGTPDVGWHLFGEQYERGEFLVKMRGLLRRHGLRESAELPDHLAHVLALVGRMKHEEADEFAGACLFPALDKMRAGVSGARQPAAGDNPFALLLEAVGGVLESHFTRPEPAPTPLRVLPGRSGPPGRGQGGICDDHAV